MKTNYTLFVGLLLMAPLLCFGQPSLNTDYFRSASTGNWSSPLTWQSSHDNVTFFVATLAPTSTAAAILVQNLHTVTINTPGVSLINTTIQSGGTLEIASTSSYAIDGTGDNLIVEGGGALSLNFTTLSAPSGVGTALVKTGGKVVANGVGSAAGANAIGDNYLNVNSKFTYQDKSIFEWNIAGYIFNSTGLKDYFKTLLSTDIPVLRISTAPVAFFGTSSNNLLNCILEVNAPFNIGGSGIKTFRGGLTGTSTITQTSGFITLPNSTSVLDGSLTINTISSGLRFTNGAIVPLGANVKIIVASQNDIVNKQSGNLQVNGTLDITNCRINNTGASASVTIATGGVLKTSNTGGFSGAAAAIVAEPIILETNSTIEFNRMGDQNFNSRSDFKNLTFSGSGIKKPGSGFDPVGTVKITGPVILDCTGYNVGDGSTNANLTMDGGRLIVSTGGTQPRMGGLYDLTGGVVEFAGTTAKTIRSETYQNIEVNGINVGNSNSNITIRDQGSFTIKSGGVFTINDNCITGPTGTQSVIVENGGTFNSGNNEGFNGFISTLTNNSSLHANIENIILDAGSTVNYMRDNNQPITNANNLIYQNLVISGIAGNKTAPSGTLTIQGSFTKSGASEFIHNNGTVVFDNAVAAQDYTCSSMLPVNFNNLTNHNTGLGLNVVNNMGIVNALTLSDNSKLNCSAGNITLLSTASNTARVAPIPASANIFYGAGRFIIERFYPNSNPVSHRAWRLVTAPLNETGTIYETWQLGGAAYGTANFHRGTLITGPQIAGNGLDFTPTNNYSLKKYDGTNFIGVDNTHVSLSPAIGIGYFLFVRGDRNPILTNIANSDHTTLNCYGKLQTGQVNIDVINAFALVGNPYASPVDFNLIDKSNNINPHRFYVWDPTINQVGAYVTMEDFATPGIFKPTAPYGGSSQNNYIQSSQAFFVVRAATGAASVSFQEAVKASNYNPLIFRPESGEDDNDQFIRADLYLLNSDSTRSIADGNMVEFNNLYSDTVDMADATKFGNVNESFSLTRHKQNLAVERRSAIKEFDTLHYHLIRTTQRRYQLEFITNITLPGLIGYWEDSYTHKSTPVNLLDTTKIDFSVDADSASASPNRFRLVFKNIGGPLPVSFSSFSAIKQNKHVMVEWKVENQLDITQFEVEKSVDGLNFIKVNTTAALVGNNAVAYSWLDMHAVNGDNFYRIRCISNYGDVTYSPIVRVKFGTKAASINIYPNPVAGGTFCLQLTNKPKGVYNIRLLNDNGQVLHTGAIYHQGGTGTATVTPNKGSLARGIYRLQVFSSGNSSDTVDILVQ